MKFVSRAGQKLDHALREFGVSPAALVCADLGCSTGGFTGCLLDHGAARVFAVDTGYGVLDWTLRNDPRVVVMERTNALHVKLAEPVQLITIDVGWTRQKNILPAAARLLKSGGQIISLIKPHYEAQPKCLRGGVLADEFLQQTLAAVDSDVAAAGFQTITKTESPIRGGKGNREWLYLLRLVAREN
jgi:23S rRNA (cytidine1920-2'-O)/16S rRNA (cytidine1409-2'-O)-methyltransferase